MSGSITRLTRTAYHEAGHAVMAYELRRRIAHVTIIPEEDILGHIQTAKRIVFGDAEYAARLPITMITKARLKMEREAMIALAGSAAVAILTNRKRSNTGCDSDYWSAYECLYCLAGEGDELPAYMNWLYQRTKAVLETPYLWQAVEALANELLVKGRVGSRRARQIIQQAIRKLPGEREV